MSNYHGIVADALDFWARRHKLYGLTSSQLTELAIIIEAACEAAVRHDRLTAQIKEMGEVSRHVMEQQFLDLLKS